MSWRQQQKLSAVFGIPSYTLRHSSHRGQGSFIAKLSGQERRRDMHRDTAPLIQAEDAVLVDTSDMTIDEVTDTIVRLVNEKR